MSRRIFILTSVIFIASIASLSYSGDEGVRKKDATSRPTSGDEGVHKKEATSRPSSGDEGSRKKDRIRVVCIGDSITFGAHVKNRRKNSYPAKLQKLLGDGYMVRNYGVNSATLIRKGQPNIWGHLKGIRATNPDIIIISLGTNDTCGGKRQCWTHKDDFPKDCRDLIDELRTFKSQPQIFICAPSPMVLETPGLDSTRKKNLEERKPRLQELIVVIKQVAKEKKVDLIDLNTPLAEHPELFREKDGVHPNEAGYQAIAELMYAALQKSANENSTTRNKTNDKK